MLQKVTEQMTVLSELKSEVVVSLLAEPCCSSQTSRREHAPSGLSQGPGTLTKSFSQDLLEPSKEP